MENDREGDLKLAVERKGGGDLLHRFIAHRRRRLYLTVDHRGDAARRFRSLCWRRALNGGAKHGGEGAAPGGAVVAIVGHADGAFGLLHQVRIAVMARDQWRQFGQRRKLRVIRSADGQVGVIAPGRRGPRHGVQRRAGRTVSIADPAPAIAEPVAESGGVGRRIISPCRRYCRRHRRHLRPVLRRVAGSLAAMGEIAKALFVRSLIVGCVRRAEFRRLALQRGDAGLIVKPVKTHRRRVGDVTAGKRCAGAVMFRSHRGLPYSEPHGDGPARKGKDRFRAMS